MVASRISKLFLLSSLVCNAFAAPDLKIDMKVASTDPKFIVRVNGNDVSPAATEVFRVGNSFRLSKPKSVTLISVPDKETKESRAFQVGDVITIEAEISSKTATISSNKMDRAGNGAAAFATNAFNGMAGLVTKKTYETKVSDTVLDSIKLQGDEKTNKGAIFAEITLNGNSNRLINDASRWSCGNPSPLSIHLPAFSFVSTPSVLSHGTASEAPWNVEYNVVTEGMKANTVALWTAINNYSVPKKSMLEVAGRVSDQTKVVCRFVVSQQDLDTPAQ